MGKDIAIIAIALLITYRMINGLYCILNFGYQKTIENIYSKRSK